LHLRNGSEGAVHPPQLRQVGDSRVVKGQLAVVSKLHDGHGGQALGHGRPVEYCVLIHGPARQHIEKIKKRSKASLELLAAELQCPD
jgi:hypothetical protein